MTEPRQPLSITAQIEAVRTTLTIARASYEIWWTYAEQDSRKKHFAGITHLSSFVRFDEVAHLWILLLQLRTLFDLRPDTVRLSFLIEQLKDESLRTTLNARIVAVASEKEKIEILRHKLIAHRDNTMLYDDVFKRAAITHDQIKRVLDEAVAIFDCVAAAHDLDGFEPFAGVEMDVRTMLELAGRAEDNLTTEREA